MLEGAALSCRSIAERGWGRDSSVDAGSTHATSFQHTLPRAHADAGISHLLSLLQLVSSIRAVKCV